MTPNVEEKSPRSPLRCPSCGKKSVVPARIPYTAKVKHDGRLYTVEISDLEVGKCSSCNEVLLSNSADEQIHVALRKQLRLLLPSEIRGNRERLGLKQRELAEQLGVADETVSRWETGLVIQSRAMDNLLRLYFDVPEARQRLSRDHPRGNLIANNGIVAIIPSSAACEFNQYGFRVHVVFHESARTEFAIANKPEIQSLIEEMVYFSTVANRHFVHSFGSIIRSHEKILRRIDSDLQQLRIGESKPREAFGYRHLRRIQMFTESLVEMPDSRRDTLLRSMLPISNLLIDEEGSSSPSA